ncbi:MAG: hypothetical protein MR825_07145 [Lawsonibacter sp.]|jgi:hypothetical protein|nr:hypothetical protein [Lawsonibacter sp.]
MKTPPDLMKGQELNHQSKTHDIPYNRKYGVLFQQDIVAAAGRTMTNSSTNALFSPKAYNQCLLC